MKNKISNDEVELKEMRKNVEGRINEFCLEIEQILDSEKPSTYGRNRKTYDDILRLVDLLKEFKFEVEKNRFIYNRFDLQNANIGY